MSAEYRYSVDFEGTLERAQAQLGAMPAKLDRATNRTMRKLMTWLKRQVLREAARAGGVTQKSLKASLRYRASRTKGGISIWIGTNPIKAHYLGTVRWTRRMRGARVGRRQFPGAWSWGEGSKTGPAVMRRQGDEANPIESVALEIHQAISRRISAMQGEINARYEKLMIQELNYALNLEAAA